MQNNTLHSTNGESAASVRVESSVAGDVLPGVDAVGAGERELRRVEGRVQRGVAGQGRRRRGPGPPEAHTARRSWA